MKDEEILKKAIERAVKNGYRVPDLKYEPLLDTKLERFYFDMQGYYAIVFSHSFAKALNFKLKDLGAWCDEGKEPLKFIEKLI